MKNIKYKIKKILSKQFRIKIKNITKNFSLKKDVQIDSLEKIELIMRIEEKFNIKIKDNEIEQLETVNNIKKYILIKKNEKK
ncbi:phosphopantetheine-binding protein [Buchnera aphidicola (Chaitoregma tattakana)]|uniref:acyl carrier protein n=1 Tax=Buchnera aphidicola TaxID=9 RepID=UPI0031B85B98